MKFINKFTISLLVLTFIASMLPAWACEGGAKERFMKGDYSVVDDIRILAESGEPDAQFLLGEAYFWGKGVSEDFDKSKYWYLKSSDQGYPDALFLVGMNMFSGAFGYTHSPEKGIRYLESAAKKWNHQAICALSEIDKAYASILSANWKSIRSENNIICQ